MWPYFVLILLPVLIQHTKFGNHPSTSARYRKKAEKAMKLFWWMLLVLLLLRHDSVGRDLQSYEFIFNHISRATWTRALSRSSEFAWSFMNKVVAEMGGNFRWVIILSAVLSVFWIAKAYVKYSEDTALVIALFIITSNFVFLFSGLRQSISISLGFLALEFVRRKKLSLFILVSVLAMLFHTSAFMLLFMYPLYHLKINKKSLVFVVPLLAVIYLFNEQIFSMLGLLLNEFTEYDTTIAQTGSITMLVLFAIFAVFAYVIPDEDKLDADTLAMRNFLLLALIVQMFAPLHVIAMRMGYYYIAFIPLAIPRIISRCSTRMAQVAKTARQVMLLFFLVYFFYSAPKDNVLYTFPYYFLWEIPHSFSGY